MLVKNNMQAEVISVKRGTTLAQLLELFSKFHSFPVVPVVDDDNTLLGIVHIQSFFDIFKPHNQDLLMHNPLSMISREPANIFDVDIEEGMGLLVIVADIMDKKIVKVGQDEDLKKAYDLMQLHSRQSIPVIDKDKRLVGLISVFDIVMKVFKERGLV